MEKHYSTDPLEVFVGDTMCFLACSCVSVSPVVFQDKLLKFTLNIHSPFAQGGKSASSLRFYVQTEDK